MKLLNTKQILTKYHVTWKDGKKLLDTIKPELEVPYATGMMRLYKPADVERAMAPLLEKRAAKTQAAEKPKEVAPQAAAPAAPPVDLTPLAKRLDEALSAVEQLQADVKTLHTQNAVLLKAIEKVGLDLSNKIDALQETVEVMPAEEPTAETPQSITMPGPVPTAAKPRVVIVGLLDSQAAMIQREFGTAFDLTIYAGSELRGKAKALVSKAEKAEHVIIMTRFVGHTAEDLVKAAGAKAIRVNGALTDLRDRLTTLFVEQGEMHADRREAA